MKSLLKSVSYLVRWDIHRFQLIYPIDDCCFYHNFMIQLRQIALICMCFCWEFLVIFLFFINLLLGYQGNAWFVPVVTFVSGKKHWGKRLTKMVPTRTYQLWWCHQMETFSALLALCAGNSPIPVTSPHKGQWRGALMFSLICTWINDWVNNREAGDMRRHRGHYDVIVIRLTVLW